MAEAPHSQCRRSFNPDQGTRSLAPQLKIPHAATEIEDPECQNEDLAWLTKSIKINIFKKAFPWWLNSKESAYKTGDTGESGSVSRRDPPDPPEKQTATDSSILAWRIPRTEELGRPQSIGSQSDTTEHAHTHLKRGGDTCLMSNLSWKS